MVAVIILALFVFAHAQNWFVQRSYGVSSCTGSPYIEAAADGGASPCSQAHPCQLTFSQPNDYSVVVCTGNGPATTITGGTTIKQYAQSGCSGNLIGITVTAPPTVCTPLSGSGSVKFACDSAGVTKMVFTDSACTRFSSNASYATGTPGQCGTRGMFISCSSSRMSISFAIFATFIVFIHTVM